MSFSFSEIMAGLIFGAIGWWMFSVGRKAAENQKVVIGLTLMLYQIFTPNTYWTWGVGVALCAYAYHIW